MIRPTARILLSLFLCSFIAATAYGQDPQPMRPLKPVHNPATPPHIVIDQPEAPLRILSYNAEYQERGNYSREGIKHSVEYENTTERQVFALQIGLVSFSVFNEFLDRTGGVSMSKLAPGKRAKGAWVASALSDFTFHTGVAYVSKVRFVNGEIWTADLEVILEELRKIEADFDEARLKPSTNE